MGKPIATAIPTEKKNQTKAAESSSNKLNLKDEKVKGVGPSEHKPENHLTVWIIVLLFSLIAIIFLVVFPWQGILGLKNSGSTQTTCPTNILEDSNYVSTTARMYREADRNGKPDDMQQTALDCEKSARVRRKKTDSLSTNSCGSNDRCSANSQCVDGADGYTCLCDEGFYGTYCEAALIDCKRLQCNNHGECRKSLNTNELFCVCIDGYSGDNCETKPDGLCSKVAAPCSDHGRCVDLADGSHVCVCEAGYHGTNCESEIDECLSNPCFHGNCTDIINGFVCDCDPGYEGVQCQTAKDGCTTSPCQNNGTCVDLPNGHICICDEGHTGADCHSVCEEEPCFNNATCSLCTGGYCNGTGLPFRCTCTDNATYGVLCTDRDGYWSQWSEWTETPITAVTLLETEKFSAPETNCTYTNKTRTRECLNHLSGGTNCEGLASDESIVDVVCECLLCCKGGIFCGRFDITECYCNEDCIGTLVSCCINNSHFCSTTTLVTRDDLY